MAVSSSGSITGSVSGGCVEGAVIEAAMEVLDTGRPQFLQFGVSDETAWEVGLACGGQIEIFVEPLDHEQFRLIADHVERESHGHSVRVFRGPDTLLGKSVTYFVGGDRHVTLDVGLAERALALAQPVHEPCVVSLNEEIELFIEVFLPPPALIIVGGVHIAVALAMMAAVLGFGVVVVDPRRAFGSTERFPDVERLIQKWPAAAFAELEITPDTAVVLLTHDPKIDDPALKIALNSTAFYIGALGSRKTHASRVRRLAGYGFNAGQIRRIHAPIGLEIGAQEPAEIALAILAEIVTARRAATATIP